MQDTKVNYTDTKVNMQRAKGIYIRLFHSASRHQALTGSAAINERNVCASSTDNETDILWLIQKGAFVQTKVASDPSLVVLI